MFFNDIYGGWKEMQEDKYCKIFDILGNEFLCNVMGKRSLDIGCGPGFFSEFAKLRGAKARIYGIDILTGGCMTADGDMLPFKKEAFDFVICVDTMHLLKGDDFRRVLKKRGFALLATFFNDLNFYERRKMLLDKLRGFEILTEFEIRGRESEYVVLARKRYC